MKECRYRIEAPWSTPHPAGNALRVEVIQPVARCTLKPKYPDDPRYSILRWIGSGGDASTVCHPCSGNCPLKNELTETHT